MGLFTKGRPTDEDTWEKWMLAESKRRTFVTVFLLDRVLTPHSFPPHVCCVTVLMVMIDSYITTGTGWFRLHARG
ncbi:hypothetical protein K440DRAFT_613340 [Wilcoxina mikolae CBS 423.85]|nr:hypothetical protein K440DRAFT_613340 [Wilcoxina mikolae CBS 423.85]